MSSLNITGNIIDLFSQTVFYGSLTIENGKIATVQQLEPSQKPGESFLLPGFIDKKTYNLIKSISVKKANGQEMEITTTFSNFQKLPEGIVVPMSMNLPIGPGVNVDFALAKVEVNKALDESIFKPAK